MRIWPEGYLEGCLWGEVESFSTACQLSPLAEHMGCHTVQVLTYAVYLSSAGSDMARLVSVRKGVRYMGEQEVDGLSVSARIESR
jgi:hypothetical protein